MTKFNKAWIFVKNYWQVVAVAIVALAGMVLGGLFARSLRRPDKTIRKELAASKAATKAAAMAVEQGKEAVVEALKIQHATKIEDFNLDQRAKLAALSRSPEGTARWLTKLSG